MDTINSTSAVVSTSSYCTDWSSHTYNTTSLIQILSEYYEQDSFLSLGGKGEVMKVMSKDMDYIHQRVYLRPQEDESPVPSVLM